MTTSSPLSSSTAAPSSSPPQVGSSLRLDALPPVFVLPTHLAVDDLHELEEKLTEHGALVTYSIAEARLVIGKVGTKRRAAMELRSRRLYTEDVTPAEPSETTEPPPAKRRKVESVPKSKDDSGVIVIDDSTTEDEDEGQAPKPRNPQTPPPGALAAEPSSSEADVFSVDELCGENVRVIRMDWLKDSSRAGRLLPLRRYMVYEGRPVAEPPSSLSTAVSARHKQVPSPLARGRPSDVASASQQQQGRSILERAKADAYPGYTTGSSSSNHYVGSTAYSASHRSQTHFGSNRGFASASSQHSGSKAALLQQTTSEYEGEPSGDLPEPPDWVTQGLKYACQRPTPAHPPNEAFIAQLKAIRLARLLRGDEIGVRAYSTSIAAIAAYPYRVTHPREMLRLPGCDAKIASLWAEWKNGGEQDVAAVREAERDEQLRTVRLFYGIWGVGAATAREFALERGWRDLDDAVEHGWAATLSRVQQIGVKFYDEFEDARIPRREVEAIAAVVRAHAARVRDDDDDGVEMAIVGGYRRGKEFQGDVDVMLSHRRLDATAGLAADVVRSLEADGWITHTLLLSLAATEREQATLPFRAVGSASRHSSSSSVSGPGFDTLDKALVVWQDPHWPSREADLAADPKARNPNAHRRVDIIVSPWRTVGCAVAGWSGGQTFQRDLRRYAKNVKGWKFDSSGVRDRRTGEVVPLEGPEGVGEGMGWEDAEKRVFEGLGLVWREPGERCTG